LSLLLRIAPRDLDVFGFLERENGCIHELNNTKHAKNNTILFIQVGKGN